LPPSIGARPVNTEYSVAPRLNWSLAGPTLSQSPAACSGLMNAAVPAQVPARVSESSVVGAASSGAKSGSVSPVGHGRGSPTRLARPQSTTSVSPNRPSMMLAGFRSRWMTLRLWAKAMALQAATTRVTSCRSRNRRANGSRCTASSAWYCSNAACSDSP
jgi:hypothetical protein